MEEVGERGGVELGGVKLINFRGGGGVKGGDGGTLRR